MKNPTAEQKVEIIKTVQQILDKPNVEIHFSLSREMRNATKDGDTAESFEPTGAIGACASAVSAPALIWPEDARQQAEDERDRLSVFQRVRQLPERWGSDGSFNARTLDADLRKFIPELFEE